MTKANYIDWENLRNIPFFLCQVVEGEQNQEIVLYFRSVPLAFMPASTCFS